MKRGEIWWASLPEPSGSEPGYRRPVLIVQADDFNRSGIRTVICAILSSNQNLATAPGNVFLSKRTSGLSRPSVANVSQLVSVDKSRITERVKALDLKSMLEIEEGLRLVLNL